MHDQYQYNTGNQGLGYFGHGKMPVCCLPNLTASTALYFTARYLRLTLEQEPMPCFAFFGGNSRPAH